MPFANRIFNAIRRRVSLTPCRDNAMKARHGLDHILSHYLPNTGFFIEAGASDGMIASNTFYLEKIKGWTGLLIEPNPNEYKKCVACRLKSLVFPYALVPSDFTASHIQLSIPNDISMASIDLTGSDNRDRNQIIEVPARTLTSILDEVGVPTIDFFSLDVEGFELSVLKGLDFHRYRPTALLVECLTERDQKKVSDHLEQWYQPAIKVSIRDFLFLIK